MKKQRQILCRYDSNDSGFSYAVVMPKWCDFLYKKVSPELMRQHFNIVFASAMVDLITGWNGKFIEINEATLEEKFESLEMYEEIFKRLLNQQTQPKTRR